MNNSVVTSFPDAAIKNKNIETDLVLQAIYAKYGYDFRNYSKDPIRRRIKLAFSSSGCKSISGMIHRLLNDRIFFEKLLGDLTVNVTEMFRDPSFFSVVRKIIVPELKKHAPVKIWHAGCSTGEEVYSMAVIIKEEGLEDNCLIYATDNDAKAIDQAKKGIFPLNKMKDYTRNYRSAGGTSSFADYYTASYGGAIMENFLKKNIVFSDHNLVTDAVFSEVNMIMCRNVLIYFNKKLQDRVLRLFWQSLGPRGFLCLGPRESLRFSCVYGKFEEVDIHKKIFKKITGEQKWT